MKKVAWFVRQIKLRRKNCITKILGESTAIFAAAACMQRAVWSHNVCISLSIGARGAILVHLALHKPQWPAAARLHISSACRSFRVYYIDRSNVHDICTVMQISLDYILFSRVRERLSLSLAELIDAQTRDSRSSRELFSSSSIKIPLSIFFA